MTSAPKKQRPRRRRPVVGAFADEGGVPDRVAEIMRRNGASQAEINGALGYNLRYAGIFDEPSMSRPVRPDVRVAQIMRLNGAFMKEISRAINRPVSTIENWLHDQHRFAPVRAA